MADKIQEIYCSMRQRQQKSDLLYEVRVRYGSRNISASGNSHNEVAINLFRNLERWRKSSKMKDSLGREILAEKLRRLVCLLSEHVLTFLK